MKKMMSIYAANLLKLLKSKQFVVAVLATFIIFMSATLYTDQFKGREYSGLSLLFGNDAREVLVDGVVNWDQIILTRNNGYIWLFAPILVSIPYISSVGAGSKNSSHRLEIFRAGKMKYILGKFLSAITAAGLVMSLAYLLYGIVLYLVFLKNGCTNIINTGMGPLLLKIASMFWYGVVSIILVFILSTIINNKYIVVCIPFMMNYFFVIFISRINIYRITTNEIYRNLFKYCEPSNQQEVFMGNGMEKIIGVAFGLILSIITILIYRISIERRVDCGD